MFVLVVAVRDPATGATKETKRSFDPTLTSAVLQTRWNALGPAVLTMITDLQTVVAADPNAPPLL